MLPQFHLQKEFNLGLMNWEIIRLLTYSIVPHGSGGHDHELESDWLFSRRCCDSIHILFEWILFCLNEEYFWTTKQTLIEVKGFGDSSIKS